MRVHPFVFHLGWVSIVSVWLMVIVFSFKNMDTSLWGVAILSAFVLLLSYCLYVYVDSVEPIVHEEDEMFTAMITEINNPMIQNGDCLACYEKLGPRDSIITSCEHRFHRDCYYHFNIDQVGSPNPDVFYCPRCKGVVQSQTILCYTGPVPDDLPEINSEEAAMVEISLD